MESPPWEPSPEGLACLRFIWNTSSDSVCIPRAPREAIVDHFYFCLLGGHGITYELNASAHHTLRSKGLLDPSFLLQSTPDPSTVLAKELSAPQFLPVTATGAFRRYRYPVVKSRVLVEATHWLAATCNFDLAKILSGASTDAREYLLSCPGFGYKTASWFLRNTGYCDRIAILDVHVVRALASLGIVPPDLSPERDYLGIERAFIEVCDIIGAQPSRLDLVLWSWERGTPVDGIARALPL